MKKSNGVNYSKTIKTVDRRKRVIKKLEIQLNLGSKITKEGLHTTLSESDIKRINKELTTLKSRV